MEGIHRDRRQGKTNAHPCRTCIYTVSLEPGRRYTVYTDSLTGSYLQVLASTPYLQVLASCNGANLYSEPKLRRCYPHGHSSVFALLKSSKAFHFVPSSRSWKSALRRRSPAKWMRSKEGAQTKLTKQTIMMTATSCVTI